MDPKQLREEAKKQLQQATALLDDAESENRGLNEAERKLYDKFKAKAKELVDRAKEREEHDAFGDELKNSVGHDGASLGAGPNGLPENNGGGNVRVVRNEYEETFGYRNQREFLTDVMIAANTGVVSDRLRQLDARRLIAAAGSDEHQTQSDPHGGFFVPETWLPGVMRTDADPDPFMGRLQTIPMGSPTVKMHARVDKDHSTSVSGGLTVSRRMETGTGSSSRMETEVIELHAYSLFGLSYASEELIADSPQTIAAILANGFQDEFDAHMIDERINGTGVGMHLGVLNSPALITISEESGQAEDTIVGRNIIKMRARCWGYQNAVWIANHDCYPQLIEAHIESPNNAGIIKLYQQSLQEDRPDTLLGRPIIYTEYANTIGDKGDLILFNGTQYLEGTYQPLQGAESIHVRFLNNERTFRFTMRNAGAPWWRSPLTPKKSSDTLSPFVVLEERTGS